MHKYFGTRLALLQELFRKEDDRYHAEVRGGLQAASGFEEIVRVFETANFNELSSSCHTKGVTKKHDPQDLDS